MWSSRLTTIDTNLRSLVDEFAVELRIRLGATDLDMPEVFSGLTPVRGETA